jgi:competence protein ComEC
VALLGGTLALLLASRLLPCGAAVLLLPGAAALATRRRAGLRLAGIALLGVALAALHAAHALSLHVPVTLEGQALFVQGSIVDLPVHDARRTRFEFLVDDADTQPDALRGKRLRLSWYAEDPASREALRAGSRWRLPVRVRAPRGLRNPGGGDAERHALVARIAGTGSVLEPALAEPLAPSVGIVAWREAMSERIAAAVPSASSRYVRALALGDTRALTDEDWTRLRAAGLTHLIAISGFHVGLVAGFFALLAAGVWWCMPSLGLWLPRAHAAGIGALLGAFAYAAMTGWALPTLRTAVMIAVLVAARALRRRHRTVDALAVACIVLILLDPLGVLTAGFWLSFAGVAWLLWCMPPAVDRRPAGMLRGLVLAQAVATLGLLPLTVVLFGQASLAGPLANLAAVPWWSLVVIPLGLLGLLADSLHAGWGDSLWRLAAWAFDLLWPGLAWFADSPLAMAWLPESRWFALPLALLGAVWLMMPRGLPARPLALLLWLPLLWPPKQLPAPGEVELTVIDVGQGLAVLVRTANRSLLYDMGPALPDGFDAGERAVAPALRGLGVRRLDAAIISHGDHDHAGGWLAVARAVPVATVLAPQGSPAPGIGTCRAGQAWTWDGVVFRMLHPTPWFPYLGNEASCVLRIESRHGSILLTGDVGEYVEQRLLSDQPDPLRNEIVVVGHHGSAGSSIAPFVQATGARLALVSSGAGNRFNHPRPAVVARWCAAGAEVLDTARSGAIRAWLGADGLQVREWRRARPRLWDAARLRHGAAGLCYPPETQRP